jgi:hypothetical protein
MQDLNDKVTGNVLTAAEWDEVASEIQNVIESTGITLSGADLNQLGKAIAAYAAGGDFYLDTGAADAYVLSTVGAKSAPPAYFNGMRIRFVAGNTNTGASTVNIAGLGVVSLKDANGVALLAGYLVAGESYGFWFDGVGFVDSDQLKANLASTATDDGTKGFHLVSHPPYSGETGVVNYEYEWGEALRGGTNTTPGTTDMSTAIKTAFAGDKPVHVSEGEYLISDAPASGKVLTIPVGKEVKGDGRRTSEHPTKLTTAASGWASTDAFIHAIGQNIIEGLHIFSSSSTAGAGLRLASTADNIFSALYRLREIEVEGFNIGIDVDNIWGSDLQSIIVRNCVKGVYMVAPNDAGDNGYYTTLQFEDFASQSNDTYGLYIAPPLNSRTFSFKNLNIQDNNTVSGTYQAYMENVQGTMDTAYFEGSASTYALELNDCTLDIRNMYLNGTGGINIASNPVALTLTQCTGASTNDGIKSTGGGTTQRIRIEQSNLSGCVFASGTLLTIVDSTINGTYYSYFSSLTPAYGNWDGSAAQGNALFQKRAYTKTITATVTAGTTSALISDQAIGFAFWQAGTVGKASFSDSYTPGLLLDVTVSTAASQSYFCVLATNTTGSDITVTSKTLNVIIERMSDYTSL